MRVESICSSDILVLPAVVSLTYHASIMIEVRKPKIGGRARLKQHRGVQNI